MSKHGNLGSARSSLLSGIGLFGFSHLEPIILAALATEAPLLLIGPHGTGKSLLLTRIAEALGLEFRHYNSSLLNFDDLVGFPLPDKDGSLEYVKTPAAIWGENGQSHGPVASHISAIEDWAEPEFGPD